VDERLADSVTNLPDPNGRITVGAFDPGATSGYTSQEHLLLAGVDFSSNYPLMVPAG
jgi:hypothetical protein